MIFDPTIYNTISSDSFCVRAGEPVPTIAVSPKFTMFTGDLFANDISEPKFITVTNNSTVPAVLEPIVLTGNFELVGPNEIVQLAPQSSHIYSIIFRPPGNSVYYGSATITVASLGDVFEAILIGSNRPIVTVVGDKGETGDRGFSAYEVATQNGFIGTELEWLESLKIKGDTGEVGRSAYDIAVINGGFQGTLEDWIESLNGTDGTNGKSAYQLALENGFAGTVTEWLQSLIGPSGKSAYLTAVENGFVGNEVEWLQSLAGQAGNAGNDGSDGLSAYQIALNQGFVGNEAAWLESLKVKGDTGDKGDKGDSTYNLSFFASTAVLSRELLFCHAFVEAVTFPANFAGSKVSCLTKPTTQPLVLNLYLINPADNITINTTTDISETYRLGSITINTNGTYSFSRVANPPAINIADGNNVTQLVVRAAPGSIGSTIQGLAITLKANPVVST